MAILKEKYPDYATARADLLQALGESWQPIEGWSNGSKNGDVMLTIVDGIPSWMRNGVRVDAVKLECRGPDRTEWRRIILKNLTVERIEEARKVLQERAEAGRAAAEKRGQEREEKHRRGEYCRTLEAELGLGLFTLHQPSTGNFNLDVKSISENQVRAIAAMLKGGV